MTATTVAPDLAFAPVESRTLKGDRAYQQDAQYWARESDPDGGATVIVAAVADGCGSGAGSGRIAKDAVRLAVPIAAAYGGQDLDRSVDAAREIIAEQRQRRGRNDNTTLVLAHLSPGVLRVAWVGDSRAYILGVDGTLRRLTQDHNLALHGRPWILTRVLLGSVDHRHGAPLSDCAEHTAQTVTVPTAGVARLLLCTDGVCGPLTDDDIASTLTGTSDASTAARRLATRAVRAARASGASADNATALVIDLTGSES